MSRSCQSCTSRGDCPTPHVRHQFGVMSRAVAMGMRTSVRCARPRTDGNAKPGGPASLQRRPWSRTMSAAAIQRYPISCDTNLRCRRPGHCAKGSEYCHIEDSISPAANPADPHWFKARWAAGPTPRRGHFRPHRRDHPEARPQRRPAHGRLYTTCPTSASPCRVARQCRCRCR